MEVTPAQRGAESAQSWERNFKVLEAKGSQKEYRSLQLVHSLQVFQRVGRREWDYRNGVSASQEDPE